MGEVDTSLIKNQYLSGIDKQLKEATPWILERWNDSDFNRLRDFCGNDERIVTEVIQVLFCAAASQQVYNLCNLMEGDLKVKRDTAKKRMRTRIKQALDNIQKWQEIIKDIKADIKLLTQNPTIQQSASEYAKAKEQLKEKAMARQAFKEALQALRSRCRADYSSPTEMRREIAHFLNKSGITTLGTTKLTRQEFDADNLKYYIKD